MPVDVPDVRDELAFDEDALGLDSTAFDDLIEGLIARETERVEDALHVSLGTETVEKDLERPTDVERYVLPLPHTPIQDLVSVSIDTDRATKPDVELSDVIVEETHLELDPDADRSSWPTTRRTITVEWEHGYPDADVPEPVRGAIIGLVRHALQAMEADGIESESIDGHSVSYEPGEAVIRRHLQQARSFEAPTYRGSAWVV